MEKRKDVNYSENINNHDVENRPNQQEEVLNNSVKDMEINGLEDSENKDDFVSSAKDERNQEAVYCVKCGYAVQKNFKRCPRCGTKIAQRKIVSKKIFIAAGVAILLVILGTGVYFTSNVSEEEKLKDKFERAYDKCSDDGTSLSDDGLSITVESIRGDDWTGSDDVHTIVEQLGLPDSLLDEMESTTALMGRQVETYDNIKVSWYYHPDDGLDVIFRIVK